MASLTLIRYRELIQSMPVMDQASVSKVATWRDHKNEVLDAVLKQFAEPTGAAVSVSRRDIFRLARGGPTPPFLYATYMWGYANGNRGQYREVFGQIDRILMHLGRAPAKIDEVDWLSEYEELTHGITGVNLSTWTKFLHFLRIDVGGWPALILDGKIIDVFRRAVFCEFSALARVSYNNGPRRYVDYLRSMYGVAAKLGVDADKLEMFLFTFGNALKN